MKWSKPTRVSVLCLYFTRVVTDILLVNFRLFKIVPFVVVFFSFISHLQKIRKSIRQNDLIPFNYYRFSWPAFIGELVYAVSCSLCWFLFKLLLYRKLVKGVQYNLTYAVVFLPLFSAMQLILLTIMIIWCRRNCS